MKIPDRLTAKAVEKYITHHYGTPRHCCTSLVKAARQTATVADLTPSQVLRLVIENEPAGHSHSYGFHTRFGRAVIDHFKDLYREFASKQPYKVVS